MKHFYTILFLAFFMFCCGTTSFAQAPAYKVAVCAPLYLDSAFNGPNYKLGIANLPKLMLPGLEFYNGVMMAIDSLNTEGVKVEVNIYDTKSVNIPLRNLLTKPDFAKSSLIIACFNSRSDVTALAEFAANKKIPLISATYPNDAGVTANPYFILLNPTLQTHSQGIYKHLQRKYATANKIMLKRKGAIEDIVANAFSDLDKSTGGIPLRLTPINLPDTFYASTLLSYLDSTKENVIFCASNNMPYNIKVVQALSKHKEYSTTVIGLPTWDAIKSFNDDDCAGVPIIYTTPFYADKKEIYTNIVKNYKAKYFSKPSDFVFKAYETMYHFSHLLVENGSVFMNHLSDKSYTVFNHFNLEAVTDKNFNFQYLENKKLYFIKKLDKSQSVVDEL